VDAHLVIWEVRCCEQHVGLAVGEECVTLYSVAVKIVGDAWFNL
jgi:hypothetical protein